MKRILLGLGSNKSFEGKSSVELLECACHDLAYLLENVIFSSVYKTKAMYVVDQNDFYNMTLLGFIPDSFKPLDLLSAIHKIEEKYGRNRDNEIRFGPRSLDIDIELFGDDVINLPNLEIPHIRIEERAFVLIPALEILRKDADCKVREKYEKCLSVLKKNGKACDVELYISAKDLKLVSGGVENGTNC